MVYAGYDYKGLETFQVESKCEHCETEVQELTVFQKFFSFCWIPCFPAGKMVQMDCPHCKKVLVDDEIGDSGMLAKFKKMVKAPMYMFTGLCLFACLFAGVAYLENQDKQELAAFIDSPTANSLVIFYDKTIDQEVPYHMMYILDKEDDGYIVMFGEYSYNHLKFARENLKRVSKALDTGDADRFFHDDYYKVDFDAMKQYRIKYVEKRKLRA